MDVTVYASNGRKIIIEAANIDQLQERMQQVEAKVGTVTFDDPTGRGESDAGYAESAARGGVQGASLGWADEISAGLQTGLGLFGDYGAVRDENRLEDYIAQQTNKKTFGAAELGGGLATAVMPLGGAARLAQGTGRLANIARATPAFGRVAAVGAGEGLLAGAGQSEEETLGGVAGDAAVSGLVGGIASPLMYAGGRGAADLLSPLVRGVGRQLYKDPSYVTNKTIRGLLPDEVDTPDRLRQALATEPGGRLATLNEGLADLTQKAQTGGGSEAADIVYKNLKGVRDKAVGRLQDNLDEAFPGVDRGYATFKNDIKLPEHVKKLYDEAYKGTIDVHRMPEGMDHDPDWFNRMLGIGGKGAAERGNSDFRKAIQRVNNSMANKKIGGVGKIGRGEYPDEIPVEYMHRLIRELRGMASKEFRAGDTAKYQDLKGYATVIDRMTKEQSEPFRRAQQFYRDKSSMEEAADYGRQLLTGKRDLDEVQMALGEMSEADKFAFRHGVKSAMLSNLLDITETGNTGNKLFKNERVKQLVREAMDDPERFDRFLNKALREQEASRRVQRNLNNSVTGSRMSFGEQSAQQTPDQHKGWVVGIFRAMIDHITKGNQISDQEWQMIAQKLTGKLSDSDLDRIFSTRLQEYGKPIGDVMAYGAGALTTAQSPEIAGAL